MAAVEFYRKGGGLIVAVNDETSVPRKGEFVNIERKTWKVDHVTWAVDQPGGKISPLLALTFGALNRAEH